MEIKAHCIRIEVSNSAVINYIHIAILMLYTQITTNCTKLQPTSLALEIYKL